MLRPKQNVFHTYSPYQMLFYIRQMLVSYEQVNSVNLYLPPEWLWSVKNSVINFVHSLVVGWFVVFGFNGPLRQYFSLYRAVSQREGERGETR